MNPSVREVLIGCAQALATPPDPEAGPEFGASRAGLAAMLMMLAAAEAEKAAAAAIAENAAMRALFARAAGYDAPLQAELALAAAERDVDLAIPALDAANARLRRLLTALHEAAEARGDRTIDDAILGLYVAMARGRRLALPGGP